MYLYKSLGPYKHTKILCNYPEPGETNLVNDIPAMNYVLSTDVEEF